MPLLPISSPEIQLLIRRFGVIIAQVYTKVQLNTVLAITGGSARSIFRSVERAPNLTSAHLTATFSGK